MAYRLTGQVSVLSIEWGGTQDGVPTWGSPITVTGKRSHRANETARTADLSSLEDTVDVMQVTRTGATYTFDLLVPDTGPVALGKIGHYCRVTVKALSTLTPGEVYAGVVTGRTMDYPDGAQVESVTITCGANGA